MKLRIGIILLNILLLLLSGCANLGIRAEEATVLYTGNTRGRLLAYPG